MSTAVSTLGDVAEFIRGINFKPDDVVPLGTEGSVGCMRTKNVQDQLDCSDVWAVAKEFVRREEQMLVEGDILVSSANSWNLVGKCSWIPKLEWPSSFGGFVSVLRANPEKVEKRFLYRWFSWERTQALLRSFGQKTTNISNLNIERCLNLALKLPSLPEQRRIAAILDQADALRVKRREALAQLEVLQQSIFIEMFGDPASNPKGWQVNPLGEVADFYAGSTLPSGEEFTGQREGYFLMRVSDMNLPGNEKEIVKCQFWYANKGARSATCPTGSIVIPKRGGAIGTNKKRIVRRPTVLDPNLMAIAPKAAVIQEAYLYQWFMAFDLSTIASGSSVPQLNKQDLAPLKIQIPDHKIQEQFAAVVGALEATKAIEVSAHKECEELFSSLQYRAFRGEL